MQTPKELIRHCYTEFAAGHIEALRPLLREDFIEHSPGNPSGRDAFLDYIAASPVASSRIDVKRIIADGDHVVVHYLMTPPGTERGIAVADIWRVEDGQVAEHWDVLQPVPEATQIPNGML